MEFQVGDKVLLKVSPWKGVIRFGKQGKLNPRYIGSFEILIRIGPMAYQLNLPAELDGVHNVFHVSNLEKYLSDEILVIPLDEIQVDERLRFVGEPVEIMDREVKRLKQSRILIARFRCNSKRGPEFTREREDQMMRKYPHLFKQTTNRVRAKSNRRNRKTSLWTRRGTRYPLANGFAIREAVAGTLSPEFLRAIEAQGEFLEAIHKLRAHHQPPLEFQNLFYHGFKLLRLPTPRPSTTTLPHTKTLSPPPHSGSDKGKSPLNADSPYEPKHVPVDIVELQDRVFQLEKDAEIKDGMIKNLREGKIKICAHLNKCKGKIKAHEKFIQFLLLENHKMKKDIKRLKGEEVSESEDEVLDFSDDSDDDDDLDGDKDQGPPNDKDQGGDSGNPSSSEKPSGLYDDLFGDIPDDILFGDCVQPNETSGAGLESIFDDLPDDFDFESPGEPTEDQAKSSAGASVEEEPENIILGNVSSDPYIDYLYAHKYIDALGKEVTSLREVINSWFDRKKDWTPSPPVDKAAWFKEMGDKHPEHTFISDDRNLFAVRNDRSNICCWMYDKVRNIYLVKRMSGKVEFYKKPRDFCSLPKVDIRSIDKAMFLNPSKDSQAELFAKFIRNQCEKDFPTMRTAKGRRFVSSCIIDTKTKKPWVYYKYPPPHVEQAVTASPRVPDNSLANFLSWYFDDLNLAAVILRNKDDINDVDIILDPMDLLKYGKEDMMKLHESPIRVHSGNDEQAKPFTRVVAYAMELKLYAGAGPHNVTLPIG
ncbi:hypothetical protein E3N88_15690 [Mikania micrantha]|uniref:Tf2-1-like SH3-like domain-containing protein n=1 Tax=Mikania micrantha TaxID=192012 RepID=A0A5N6NW48_9ASTR|nr:hypothetical protein E3N88_15690 [Mikania micrantha]